MLGVGKNEKKLSWIRNRCDSSEGRDRGRDKGKSGIKRQTEKGVRRE